MILDFFKARNPESKPSRFTILVNGWGYYTVESNREYYSDHHIAPHIPHGTAKAYFAGQEYNSEGRAKRAIDEFMQAESMNATRPVCQYP